MQAVKLMWLRLKKASVVATKPFLRKAFFRFGVLAAVEHKWVITQDFKTVVDIGANRGQFSLAVRAFSEAKIYAFEPLEGPAVICKNIFANDDNFELFQVAIGEVSGNVDMHVAESDDSSSLLEIGSKQVEYYPSSKEVGLTKVRVGTLDEFIPEARIGEAALLKIDVQGYELNVLKGCTLLLDKFQYIYCECSFVELYTGQATADEVIIFLSNRGFKLIGTYNVNFDASGRTSIQADLLFVNIKNS